MLRGRREVGGGQHVDRAAGAWRGGIQRLLRVLRVVLEGVAKQRVIVVEVRLRTALTWNVGWEQALGGRLGAGEARLSAAAAARGRRGLRRRTRIDERQGNRGDDGAGKKTATRKCVACGRWIGRCHGKRRS